MNKNILEINYFHIELGHTLKEYRERFGLPYCEGDLWDYSLEDVKFNAVEGECNVLYWGIVVDNELRVFETTIQQEFEINYQVLQDYIWYIYRLDERNCIVEVYNERMGKNLPDTKKSIIDIIIQDKDFLKIVYQEEYPYIYKWLANHNCYETRTIKFFDDYGDIFITTNAPSFLIEEAIKYRDLVLTYDLPFVSDFDCIRDYIQEKGFDFDEIKVADEKYYW